MNIFSLISILVCLIAAASVTQAYDFNDIIANIPEEERNEFLKYHLNLGYSLSQESQKYANKENLPEDFSISLYEYAKDNHDIKDETVLASLRSIICFDDGTCIDIGDIGIHPMKVKKN